MPSCRAAIILVGGSALAAAGGLPVEPMARPAVASPLTPARPAKVRLDPAWLARTSAWLRGEVEAGRSPGGAFGTSWVDPAEEVYAVPMLQVPMQQMQARQVPRHLADQAPM